MNRQQHKQQDQEAREYTAWRAARWTLIALLAGLLLALLVVPARAGENQFGVPGSELGARETAEQNLETFLVLRHLDNVQKISYLAVLAVVDYRQSVDAFFHHPGKPYEHHQEQNPILGPRPSRGELAAFGLAGVAATALISRSDHPLARIVVDSIVATEQVNVWQNQYAMTRQSSLPIMVVMAFQF